MNEYLRNLSMRKPILTLLLMLTGLIAGCGDSNTLVTSGGTPGGGPAAPTAASLQLLTSNPQLPSDGSATVTITALARDASNIFVEGVPVSFATDSGGLNVVQGTTDSNGQATATLSVAGDPTNRSISVSGTAGTLSSSVAVNVVGTTLTVTGPGSLVSGATATYTVVLSNAGGNGIANTTVDVSSAAGSTISPVPPLTTDSTGQAQFDLTASTSDTLTISALGQVTTKAIAVSTDSFAFTSPAANTEVNLGTPQTLVVNLQSGGSPVVGETISFSTTRGTLTSPTDDTDASGNATVDVSSANAGAAVISATTSGGVSTTLTIEFVATTPATVTAQASP
ncbi:MAG: Ig-like domain-containing protein, partial [Gammaproteobacteria bacterium]|nr:Ig-like domain-containing protein [Gammaproteobacteria bacterium]